MAQEQQFHNDEGNESSSESNGKMFFTTSDLLQKMNSSISDICPDAKFELHVKDPATGVSIKADEKQVNRADLESKIKQSAGQVQGMSAEDKFKWAKMQRNEGNSLFKAGRYAEAMDVYVTCLVGADIKCPDDRDASRLDTDLKLPILLNLALCALKLREYSKAEQFCSLALDLKDGDESVKLWFRRGKARMGRGSYKAAREDFREALSCKACSTIDEADIRRELRRISELERLSRSSLRKQKKAMQALLGGSTERDTDEETTPIYEQSTSLYEDIQQKRTFSALTDDPILEEDIGAHSNSGLLLVSFSYILSPFLNCLKNLFAQRRKTD